MSRGFILHQLLGKNAQEGEESPKESIAFKSLCTESLKLQAKKYIRILISFKVCVLSFLGKANNLKKSGIGCMGAARATKFTISY